MFTREGNHPDDYSRVTYKKLTDLVCQFANALRDNGVGKGDRVAIYMPMILETVVCMLACARIGAVHSVVVRPCNVPKRVEKKGRQVIEYSMKFECKCNFSYDFISESIVRRFLIGFIGRENVRL